MLQEMSSDELPRNYILLSCMSTITSIIREHAERYSNALLLLENRTPRIGRTRSRTHMFLKYLVLPTLASCTLNLGGQKHPIRGQHYIVLLLRSGPLPIATCSDYCSTKPLSDASRNNELRITEELLSCLSTKKHPSYDERYDCNISSSCRLRKSISAY